MPQIRETGAELVAISPQIPEQNAKISKRHKLEYDVLSDLGNKVAGQWGLAHAVEGELRKIYEGFKIDLDRFNGEGGWNLPIPARFVLATDGKVLSASSDPDYTRRPEPSETVDFLKGL